ncbi:MAG TPA: rRNA maturation RNase YbeY [Candidatus Paceibacterota bacterium]|nr:rRNA maturation RNase YbeY [Candidatus Paceibacterota bacterium]HOK97275.1 rRNA maturation RNase YbeY [Candidatus Paceibacterota bacterium]HPP64710.1 rRNA maturation RNase YbeY [Candidatus Paceibacterota bacterium]
MKTKAEILIYNYTKERIPSKKFFSEKLNDFLKKLKENKSIEIALVFVNPSQIKKLNYYWRKKNKVTSTLSFSSQIAFSRIKDLGEIFFCPQKIKQEAKKYKIKELNLYSRLLAHSLLHLYGFSHSSKTDSKKMIQLEKLLLENK